MKSALCWIRRDLRLHDHHALSEALKSANETYVVFVFDEIILNKLHNKNDPRLTFIIDSLKEIEELMQKHNSSLIIRYGDPVVEIPKLVEELKVDALFFNRDYEPYAKARDAKIANTIIKNHTQLFTYKDHVFFESNEVLNGSNETYKVFTPYKNKWLELHRSHEEYIPKFTCDLKKLANHSDKKNILSFDWLYEIGFLETPSILKGGSKEAIRHLQNFKKHISNYKKGRDIPALKGTSNLSPYIRMGNLSIRDMIRLSYEQSDEGHATWLSEIIWRDFYHTILDVYPNVEKKCFRQEYDKIIWLGKKEHFEMWCDGMTGYPLVDAAMRCLNITGMMHNRLRMVVASFLTKTLLIDWRLGEQYFAQKLLDFDLAANNGGWQWSASTGVDAQPYFRIFNPYNQSEKFDPEGIFIRQWCPELSEFSNKKIHYPQDTDMAEQAMASCLIGVDYPHPIVAYAQQRSRALSMYKTVK